jgi:uncharacterized lipoprotein YddW (UPF0748 family)
MNKKQSGTLSVSLLIPIFLFFSHLLTASSPIYEFRGVWVATITNIDWPSKPGLSMGALKKEALDIITTQHAMGMNAIILQVRPAGDAIYPSALAPWSKYLTGEQGLAPSESDDLLEFWIDECHKRNMELHAWINPFRAALHSDEILHISHPALVNPHWTVEHNKRLYYNPGMPEVRQHILNVITDLVSRYDINGLHIDDYFYPYPANGEVFNDTATYISQLDFEHPISIHDWRRNNIDLFVQEANNIIHQVKPWVKFGISPFGVWRNIADDPRGSDSRAGVTSYDNLYADVIKWAELGWIDYVVPQIYWSTQDEAANFIKMADWWNLNVTNRHLYIGHGIYKINGTQKHWDNPQELKEQLRHTRQLENVKGSAFYSHNHFMRENNNLNSTLQDSVYKMPALTPPMPWLNNMPPQPVSKVRRRSGALTWEMPLGISTTNKPLRYIVFIDNFEGQEEWYITTNRIYRPRPSASNKKRRYKVSVATIDLFNNISDRTEPIRVRF